MMDRYNYGGTGLVAWCMATVAVALLIWLIVVSWQSGMAYALEYRANRSLDQWYASGTVPTAERWQTQESAMKRALLYLPANASMLNTLGRLYAFRLFVMNEQASNARTLYSTKVLDFFQQAADRSPAWVYPWLNIARTRAKLGHLDSQFFVAYEQAVQRGPWEGSTMPDLVALGVIAYHSGTTMQKHDIEAYLNRVAMGDGPLIGTVLQKRGNRSFICRGLKQIVRTHAYQRICVK